MIGSQYSWPRHFYMGVYKKMHCRALSSLPLLHGTSRRTALHGQGAMRRPRKPLIKSRYQAPCRSLSRGNNNDAGPLFGLECFQDVIILIPNIHFSCSSFCRCQHLILSDSIGITPYSSHHSTSSQNMDPSQVDVPPLKDLTIDNITDNVKLINSKCPDPRFKYLLERLVQHLHDYARETRLSHNEWMTAIQFLTSVGQTCTDVRQVVLRVARWKNLR
jgi:hypothetical protein